MQPDVVDLWYFIQRIVIDQTVWVRNIQGLIKKLQSVRKFEFVAKTQFLIMYDDNKNKNII